MLVIERKIDEQIEIGDAVITIVALRHGSVRVGVQAPPGVVVRRRTAKSPPPDEQPPVAGRSVRRAEQKETQTKRQ